MAAVISPYVECDRCEGSGYAHVFGPYYRLCRGCGGSGERPRLAYRIWTALRHGAAVGEDY